VQPLAGAIDDSRRWRCPCWFSDVVGLLLQQVWKRCPVIRRLLIALNGFQTGRGRSGVNLQLISISCPTALLLRPPRDVSLWGNGQNPSAHNAPKWRIQGGNPAMPPLWVLTRANQDMARFFILQKNIQKCAILECKIKKISGEGDISSPKSPPYGNQVEECTRLSYTLSTCCNLYNLHIYTTIIFNFSQLSNPAATAGHAASRFGAFLSFFFSFLFFAA